MPWLTPNRITVDASSSPLLTKLASENGSSTVSTPSRKSQTFDLIAEMKPPRAAGLLGACCAPATVPVQKRAVVATRAARAGRRSIRVACNTSHSASQGRALPESLWRSPRGPALLTVGRCRRLARPSVKFRGLHGPHARSPTRPASRRGAASPDAAEPPLLLRRERERRGPFGREGRAPAVPPAAFSPRRWG